MFLSLFVVPGQKKLLKQKSIEKFILTLKHFWIRLYAIIHVDLYNTEEEKNVQNIYFIFGIRK